MLLLICLVHYGSHMTFGFTLCVGVSVAKHKYCVPIFYFNWYDPTIFYRNYNRKYNTIMTLFEQAILNLFSRYFDMGDEEEDSTRG